jgi:hypothetical protein
MKEKIYCTCCGSLLDLNNCCSNKDCKLKKEEIQKQLDKIFYEEFEKWN